MSKIPEYISEANPYNVSDISGMVEEPRNAVESVSAHFSHH